ncbi:S41 family peptidase [Microaceticoccus formicicus]|uniref:S41 family peptidase n=1 Tax=Microaceticoccus formicicus TaxID=3118105 RepID=UPI003CD032D9|nr:S41 family peptidase [Peptoniphilaceae bacterium AMB_02]
MDKPRKNRRRRKVRINYTRLIISIIVLLLIIFILFTGVKALFKRASSGSTSKDNTAVETDTSEQNKLNPDGQLSPKSKLEDFEFVNNLILNSHPYYDENVSKKQIDWKKVTETYKKKITDSQKDQQFIDAITQFVSQLNDEQTHILNYDFYNYLLTKYNAEKNTQWLKPLNLESVKSRYNVLSTEEIDNLITEKSSNTAGSNLILDTPIVGQLAYIKVKSFDERHKANDGKSIMDFLNSINTYKNLVIDITNVKDGLNSYWIDNLVAPLISSENSVSGRIAKKDDTFKDFLDYAYKNKHRYITFGDEFPIGELPLELNVQSYVRDKFKNYKRFDITVEPKDSVGYEGKIFLLQDKKVYGAADTFAQFCKSTGFATIMGTTTRGYGMNAEIEPVLVALPNSGLILRMPTVMGLNYDGTGTALGGTPPDIEINKDVIDLKEIIDYIN